MAAIIPQSVFYRPHLQIPVEPMWSVRDGQSLLLSDRKPIPELAEAVPEGSYPEAGCAPPAVRDH